MKLDYVVTIGVDKHYFKDKDNAQIEGWCAVLKGLLNERGFECDIKVVTEDINRNNVIYPVTWTLQIDGNRISIPKNASCMKIYADIFTKRMLSKLSLESVSTKKQLDEIKELMCSMVQYLVNSLRIAIIEGIAMADDYLEKYSKKDN